MSFCWLIARHRLTCRGEPTVAIRFFTAGNGEEFILQGFGDRTAFARADLMAIHANAALSLGATKEQVAEAVLAALPVAGMAVWSKSADVIAAL